MKLADKRAKVKKVRICWGNEAVEEEDKGSSVDGINTAKSCVIARVHTKDPSAEMYMDEEEGELGTGTGSVGPRLGGEIGSVLGGHGGHLSITADGMLHLYKLASAAYADTTALLSHLQDSGDSNFKPQQLLRFGLEHADRVQYGGAYILNKGPSFTGHVSQSIST